MSRTGNLYADLSAYYDLFCADVNYAEQCDFALRAVRCFGESQGKAYLDLACGTGAHIAIMQTAGFIATGLDNSADMLNLTARRCPGVQCWLSEMSALEVEGQFDLITCFLYSIHYNHPVSVFRQTLQRAFAALKPGGLFLFDTVDIKGINNRHRVRTSVTTELSTLTFSSGWTYAGAGETMLLDLSIGECMHAAGETGHRRCWQDQHRMAAVDIRDTVRWLQETGFEVTLLEHDYSRMQPWSGETFNIIVVASKPFMPAC